MHDEKQRQGVMTRQQVSDRLGVAVSTVRRMEGRDLHPEVGIDGVRRFLAEEVEALAAKRPPRQARESSPRAASAASLSITGEVAAGVFEDLEEGKPTASIVVARQLPPEVVRRLHADWLSLRELDLDSPRTADRIAALQARVEALERVVFEPSERPTLADLFAPRPPSVSATEVLEGADTMNVVNPLADFER